MSHTYYLDSATGNDANTGTSAGTAFKSIAALNGIALQPGDTVLLARGTSYSEQLTIKGSGASGHPITIGAYGEGAAPVIKDAATGIYGAGTHDVVVHDIAIAGTSGYALLGTGVSNWTVDNVAVSGTGSVAHSGAVSFEDSANVTVENSTISGVTGDGILVNGGHDLTIANDKVSTVQGPEGDNVQVNGTTNVKVTGNHLDMSGGTNSTKGNLVVNRSDHVDIEHNTLTGGKYGASVNSNNVTIASNDIHGQHGYNWSFGIGVGENWNVGNYDIRDNNIHDVPYGVALTGESPTVTRSNIDVTGNTFEDSSGGALKVDRAASGEFAGNHVAAGTTATLIPDWISAQGKFLVANNDSFDAAHPAAAASGGQSQVSGNGQPVAINDAAVVNADGTATGNVLSDDQHGAGQTLYVRFADGERVDSAPAKIAGQYGTLSIAADGHFSYAANDGEIADKTGTLHDSFSYKMSDGSAQDHAYLDFSIDAHALQASSDFHI